MVGRLGVSTNDFQQIFNDFNRSVSYSVVTKTTDPMTGAETSTFASASAVSVIYFKEDCRWMFDKQGLIQLADSYILAPLSVGIKRYDKFTIDGLTYYIEEVISRYVLGTQMLDFGRCFLVSA